MKKLFSFIFATLFALQTLAVTTFEIGNLKYTVTDEINHCVSVAQGSTAPTGALEIPSQVIYPANDGVTYTVTNISRSAFYGCGGLTSVSIPNSVASIGWSAFDYCYGLASVTIPNSVTEIGDFAFRLVKNIIYEGNASGRPWGALNDNGVIDNDFIYADEKKATLTAYIGNDSSVIIPVSVTRINDSAFWGCFIKSVEIPNSVLTIGSQAFCNCTRLTSVSIPNSVVNIESSAFYNCSNLGKAEFSSIGNLCKIKFDNNDSNPLSYARRLFVNGEEVTQVIIPDSVMSIGDYTFYNCSSLTSVFIPEGVTCIGKQSFSNCSNLITITIPNSVISIEGSFAGCKNIEYNEYDNALYLGNKENPYHALIQDKIYNIESCEINNKCKVIADYAFFNCALALVTIPNSVINIGKSAFCQCNNITTITIPNSVITIGDCAFENCKGLTSVVISEGVTSIGGSAFIGCSSLTSVSMPNSITDIGFWAFRDCNEKIYTKDGWGNMYLGNKQNKYIALISASETINYCEINNNCKVIATGAFTNSYYLWCATIPESVTNIGHYAFRNNENMGGTFIYCRQTEIPTGWADDWCRDCTVELGCKMLNLGNNYGGEVSSEVTDGGMLLWASWYTNNANVTINASPLNGYHFEKWKDGNTDNPRTIIMNDDLTMVAIFSANATAVTETSINVINIYATGNTIIVENATDEIRVYNAMGALVGRDAINRVRAEIPVNGTGVYLVKVGNVAKRVMVN